MYCRLSVTCCAGLSFLVCYTSRVLSFLHILNMTFYLVKQPTGTTLVYLPYFINERQWYLFQYLVKSMIGWSSPLIFQSFFLVNFEMWIITKFSRIFRGEVVEQHNLIVILHKTCTPNNRRKLNILLFSR